MTPTAIAAGALAAALPLAGWFALRRREEVPCTLDLESTPEHFHAHAVLDGAVVHEGDAVQLFDAPSHIAPGEKRVVHTRAAVAHASAPRRWWTRVVGVSEISSLYEVGFEG
ncbi:hypothetical protein tb265_20610 [Gemmatimonadetes bacterium T265]|nr:hypothetical protein tb265_20610 [Gemmatimonadetes bacterium T265]